MHSWKMPENYGVVIQSAMKNPAHGGIGERGRPSPGRLKVQNLVLEYLHTASSGTNSLFF
jgi:hypothetical protein